MHLSQQVHQQRTERQLQMIAQQQQQQQLAHQEQMQQFARRQQLQELAHQQRLENLMHQQQLQKEAHKQQLQQLALQHQERINLTVRGVVDMDDSDFNPGYAANQQRTQYPRVTPKEQSQQQRIEGKRVAHKLAKEMYDNTHTQTVCGVVDMDDSGFNPGYAANQQRTQYPRVTPKEQRQQQQIEGKRVAHKLAKEMYDNTQPPPNNNQQHLGKQIPRQQPKQPSIKVILPRQVNLAVDGVLDIDTEQQQSIPAGDENGHIDEEPEDVPDPQHDQQPTRGDADDDDDEAMAEDADDDDGHEQAGETEPIGRAWRIQYAQHVGSSGPDLVPFMLEAKGLTVNGELR